MNPVQPRNNPIAGAGDKKEKNLDNLSNCGSCASANSRANSAERYTNKLIEWKPGMSSQSKTSGTPGVGLNQSLLD